MSVIIKRPSAAVLNPRLSSSLLSFDVTGLFEGFDAILREIINEKIITNHEINLTYCFA
jgi:hypothetical protein